MNKTILGIFSNRLDAESAIEDLKTSGYNPKDISVVMKDTSEMKDMAQSTGTNVGSGAASGATTGGVVGAIAGLLIGVGAIAIPGIGGLLIGGPIAAALGLTGAAATTATGALTGALAGGLIGGLIGLGVPEEDAKVYEQKVNTGGILVAVPSRLENEGEVSNILSKHNVEKTSIVEMR